MVPISFPISFATHFQHFSPSFRPALGTFAKRTMLVTSSSPPGERVDSSSPGKFRRSKNESPVSMDWFKGKITGKPHI